MATTSFGGAGLIGGGILAIAIFIFTWFKSRKGADAIADLSKLKDSIQGKSEQKIDSIVHDQSKIEVKIAADSLLAIEKQKAIKNIADNAAVEVDKIMKEKDLSKLTSQYNKDLQDL